MSFLQPLLPTHTPAFDTPREPTRQAKAACAAANNKRGHKSGELTARSTMHALHLALCNDTTYDRAPIRTPPRPEPKPPLFLLTLVGAATAAYAIIQDPELMYTPTAEQSEEFLLSLSGADLASLPLKLRRAIESL